MDPIKTHDGQIVVVDPYGIVGTVPPAELGVLIQQGYRFASPEENHAQYLQNEYGNQPLAAAAEGVARSATFGGYDVAARALGAEEAVGARKRLNPGAALAGEIGGYALPGGAGALLGKAGKAAAGAVGLGEATGIGGRIAAGAVRAGAEGGLVGVQQTVSDVALSDHPLSAEAILSDLGSNVIYGAAVGGAIGAGTGTIGGILSATGSRVRARAQVVAQRLGIEGEIQAERAAIPKFEAKAELNPADFTPEEFARRKALLEKINAVHGKMMADIGGELSNTPLMADVDQFARQLRREGKPVPSALGATPEAPAAATANLRARTPEIPPKGGTLDLATPASSPGPEPIRSSDPPQVPENRVGAEPASSPPPDYQAQGRAGSTLAGAPPPELWPRIEAAYEKAQGKLSEVEERLEKVYRRDTIRDAGDTIPGGRGRGRPKNPEAGALPDLLEQHRRAVGNLVDLEAQVEAIRAAPAPVEPTMRRVGAPEAPVAARAELPRAPTARPLAEKPLALADTAASPAPAEAALPEKTAQGGPPSGMDEVGQMRERVADIGRGKGLLAPVGQLLRHLGGAAGFVGGQAIGHPFIGAAVGRWAGRGFDNLINGRGALGVQLKLRVGQFAGALQNGVSTFANMAPREAVVSRAPAPATSLLKGLSYAPPSDQPDRPARKGDELGKAFAARADELSRSITDMPGTQQRIHNALAGLRVIDPKSAAQVEETALRKLQFLYAVLPKNAALGTPFDGYSRGQRVSDAAIHDFARYAAAAEDPRRLVDELNAGRLTPQTVEATKAVYPETFSAVRQDLLGRVDQLQSLSYAKRVQLSVLFEAPLDSTMQPETVAALQKTFALEHDTNGGMAPPNKTLGSVKKQKTSAPEPTKAQQLSGT